MQVQLHLKLRELDRCRPRNHLGLRCKGLCDARRQQHHQVAFVDQLRKRGVVGGADDDLARNAQVCEGVFGQLVAGKGRRDGHVTAVAKDFQGSGPHAFRMAEAHQADVVLPEERHAARESALRGQVAECGSHVACRG